MIGNRWKKCEDASVAEVMAVSTSMWEFYARSRCNGDGGRYLGFGMATQLSTWTLDLRRNLGGNSMIRVQHQKAVGGPHPPIMSRLIPIRQHLLGMPRERLCMQRRKHREDHSRLASGRTPPDPLQS